MRQGIFVLLIERATYPEKPNQIQFPKEKPPIPKTKQIQISSAKANYPTI